MLKKISIIKKRVASICKAETANAAAYVFGSYAQGKEKKSSDLDVALLLNETNIIECILADIKSNVKELRDDNDITWDIYRTDVRARRFVEHTVCEIF